MVAKPEQGKTIIWMVWGLVILGLATGIATLGLFDWTLFNIRTERERLAKEERQTLEASSHLKLLVLEGQEAVRILLDDFSDVNQQTLTSQSNPIAAHHTFLRSYQKDQVEPRSDLRFVQLDKAVNAMEVLWKDAVDWRRKYHVIQEDLRGRHSLKIVRSIMTDLRGAVKSLEGRRRLQNVIQLQKWKRARGVVASKLGQEILSKRGGQADQAVRDLQTELADLSSLIETLAGEDTLDNLINLKDNQFNPSLQRLKANFAKLAAFETLPSGLKSTILEDLSMALFGAGFSIDVDHQTIQVGNDGLYRVRYDVLALRRQQAVLQQRLQHVSQEIQVVHQYVTTEIQRNAQVLAEQIEVELTQGRETVFISGLLCSVAFLLLAWLVSNRISQQVRDLEHAKLDFEEQSKELGKARDGALETARLKSEFLATMSHEIRTPMNGVIGMTSLLIDSDLTGEQQDFVETIRHSGESLLNIINDILDFSKIEAGKMELEIVPFDLREALEEVLELLAEKASQKKIELVGVVATSVPTLLLGDPGRIRQVLTNLVGNALKFTDQGEVAVFVVVDGEAHDSITIRFDVVDTGIGMTPEGRSRLFQSFSQADGSTTRKYGGTGLGLVISQRLVHIMNGSIGVDSEIGRGSRFWFTIELGLTSPESVDILSPREGQFQGLRVCLVDDNSTNLTLLQHFVTNVGLRYAIAWNGKEALALMRQEAEQGDPFSLAIVDFQMPEMDGMDLAKQIKADPVLASMPLVMLTSIGQRGEIRLAQESGLAAFLIKPVRQNQLHRVLNAVIDGEHANVASSSGKVHALFTHDLVKAMESREKIRVLLVEDNVVNQKVAVRMLEKIGVRVDVAANGYKAVNGWTNVPYDVIFMDCHMPEMDGYEATREIRKKESGKLEGSSKELGEKEAFSSDSSFLSSDISRFPSHSRIPIVALTANAMQGDREKCLDVGMNDFLTKPVTLENLKHAIMKWIPEERLSIANVKHTEGMAPHKGEGEPAVSIELERESAPLDDDILADLRVLGGEDDPEFFQSLVEQFLLDAPAHVQTMHRSCSEGDCQALTISAHTLKGSARNMGALPLSKICSLLEEYAREATLEMAESQLHALDVEFSRACEALRQEVSRVTLPVSSIK